MMVVIFGYNQYRGYMNHVQEFHFRTLSTILYPFSLPLDVWKRTLLPAPCEGE